MERKVAFDIRDTGVTAEVVQSLAKWKRKALKDYDFHVGKGLYCDMNAIRRDEELDNLHSVYVDQWDWEKVIREEDRNLDYLQGVVRGIVSAVCATEMNLHAMFPQLEKAAPSPAPTSPSSPPRSWRTFTPALEPKERENAFVKEHGTTFLMQIGHKLRSGRPHDGRAPDYDDLGPERRPAVLERPAGLQLRAEQHGHPGQPRKPGPPADRGRLRRPPALPFHKALLAGELPCTIGGGIGQSRLCMLLLGSAHIGEVQAPSGTPPPAQPARRPASTCCNPPRKKRDGPCAPSLSVSKNDTLQGEPISARIRGTEIPSPWYPPGDKIER